MGSVPDYVRKKYGPLLAKTLETALTHCIATEFPRLGGPRIQQLCAKMILEVVARHFKPREHLHHGQVLWLGISRENRPRPYRSRRA